MSLGGPKSDTIDAAIEAAVAAGITVAVAAGNENQNACDVSPANVPVAITVGATSLADEVSKEIDARASFSNWGPCVDILAPGALITSAWIGAPNAIKTISGTSMATPHVCGVATAYLTNFPTATPAEVTSYLLSNSTNGVIDLTCSGAGSSSNQKVCRRTPNKMLYWNCDN
jgi:aqualysin 1